MKVLLVLGVLLLSVIVALIVGNAATGNGARESGSPVGNSVAAAPPLPVAGSRKEDTCPDEEQLRRIIREELAAQLTTNSASGSPQGSEGPSGSSREGDSSRQLASVSQQLDQYILAGRVSESEMAALQIEMGKLDKSGQREMLKKLTRAINSGALAGDP